MEKRGKVNKYCLVCNLSWGDNVPLIVVTVAPRFKFNAMESIGYVAGAPVDRGQMSGRVS